MRAFRIGGLAAVALLAVACAGRATSPVVERSEPTSPTADGVFHTVEPGQTLWRIARAYGVDVEALRRINRIDDVHDISVGTKLWIPRARTVLAIPPAFPVPGDRRPGGSARFLRPIEGAMLSGFGAPRGGRIHRGIDLRGRSGEPIHATDAGTVAFSGTMRGYGWVVILDHRGGWRSVYAHNRENLVRQGDRVSRGAVIARVGRSGNATTEHCHFELRRDDIAVDPLPHLGAGGSTERTSNP